MTSTYRAVLEQYLTAADNVTVTSARSTTSFIFDSFLNLPQHRDILAVCAQVLIDNLRPIWEKQAAGDELRERMFDLMDLIAQWRRSAGGRFTYFPRTRVARYEMGKATVIRKAPMLVSMIKGKP